MCITLLSLSNTGFLCQMPEHHVHQVLKIHTSFISMIQTARQADFNIHFQQCVEARVYYLFLQVPRARKGTEEVKPIEKKKFVLHGVRGRKSPPLHVLQEFGVFPHQVSATTLITASLLLWLMSEGMLSVRTVQCYQATHISTVNFNSLRLPI